MAEQDPMQDMMKPMMAVMMIAVMAAIVLPLVAQAAPPAPAYCCAIHARLGTPTCFNTYAELEAHYVAEHPATSIEITWE